MDRVNYLKLETIPDKYLYADVFYTNSSITILCPYYYEECIDHNDINVIFDGCVIKSKQLKKSLDVILIIFDIGHYDRCVNITVTYSDMSNTYNLNNCSNSHSDKHRLTLSTLFKNDYKLFDKFYKYYKLQGVCHFYLYYNGKIFPELQQLMDKDDVTLIEWNFHYRNKHDPNNPLRCNPAMMNHAQPLEMHHALYKYAKSTSHYMIFNDFDEYMSVGNDTIKKFIDNSLYDVYVFNNIWSNMIINTDDMIPDIIAISDTIKYPSRSKCIYKTDSICFINIHQPLEFNIGAIRFFMDGKLFHFFNWVRSTRAIEMKYICDIRTNSIVSNVENLNCSL